MRARLLLLAHLLLLPLPGQAHMDVIYARVEFHPAGMVKLVQQVDFAENPLVPDELAARQTLETGLGVDRGKGYEPPAVLGKPEFNVVETLHATTPPAYVFANEHATKRRFLEASWTFHPTESLRFAMPAAFPLDAVVWTVPSDRNMEKAVQFYLICGETTFGIPLEHPDWKLPSERKGSFHVALAILGVLVLGLVVLAKFGRVAKP